MSFKIAIVAFVLLNSHGQDLVLGKQSQPGSDHVNQVSPFVGLADYMKRSESFLFKFVHADATSDNSPELELEAQQFAETSKLFLDRLDQYVKERGNSSSTPKTLSLFSR
ncbi:unnamed protein product [Albugo candida]|uniref:RxLR effector protein n=1 Tax=Albugo candida TaxID=65357 RepID=A0A024FYP9_9STRA|nr:unnamed protein product [Albugo candida]|eukprot:CCI11799.1 unnamed protein product [Albugo candida]